MNNYLTLLIWAGEIKEALKVSLLNIKALSWIAEDWIYCWQYEHGFSSIGYLFLLAGEYTTAEKYYRISEGAWAQKNEATAVIASADDEAIFILLGKNAVLQGNFKLQTNALGVASDKGLAANSCRNPNQQHKLYSCEWKPNFHHRFCWIVSMGKSKHLSHLSKWIIFA